MDYTNECAYKCAVAASTYCSCPNNLILLAFSVVVIIILLIIGMKLLRVKQLEVSKEDKK